MPPRFSILIPAFNAAPWVEAAVCSVLGQTFSDWEVIAVDDASTDSTLSILKSFEGPRFRVEANQTNLGMTPNWNRCLSFASGEMVLKLDADDALKPRALEMLAAAFSGEVIAAGMRSLQCDADLDPFDGIQGDDAMQRNGIDPYRDAILPGRRWYDISALGFQLWSSSAFAIRRDFLHSGGGWDERFGCASDTEMMWRAMETGRPVAHCGAVGALYRVRPGSISDEYRSRGWLTWEGVAANLLSIGRERLRRPLSRAVRMHFVRQWSRWHASSEKKLPPSLLARLEDAARSVAAPPLADRVMTMMRDRISSR